MAHRRTRPGREDAPSDVLILCADETAREALAYWLRSSNVATDVAVNGYDASERLRSGAFRLLVTDRLLPPWPGLDAFVMLKQRLSGLRIAFIDDGVPDTKALARGRGGRHPAASIAPSERAAGRAGIRGGGGAMRLISLVLALFLFWLALSGHYTPTLIAVGAASAVACALVAARMGIADREGHPIHLAGRFVTFFPWLLCEIAKSAWAVTKIIVNPALPISPTMTRVQASQRSSLGVVTYANSITLTPGTITTGVKANVLTVHALVREGALDLEAGGMDARVTRFEGRG